MVGRSHRTALLSMCRCPAILPPLGEKRICHPGKFAEISDVVKVSALARSLALSFFVGANFITRSPKATSVVSASVSTLWTCLSSLPGPRYRTVMGRYLDPACPARGGTGVDWGSDEVRARSPRGEARPRYPAVMATPLSVGGQGGERRLAGGPRPLVVHRPQLYPVIIRLSPVPNHEYSG